MNIRSLLRYNNNVLKIFIQHFLSQNSQLIQKAWDARLPIKQIQKSRPLAKLIDPDISSLKSTFLNHIENANENNFCEKKLASKIKYDIKQLEYKHDEISHKLKCLTKREKSCLELVVQGLTSKEIATELALSFRTIENYNNARASLI